MYKLNLTGEEINAIKELIYNEIDKNLGIENINEYLVLALKELQKIKYE